MDGFVEADGYVSIEAEHYTKKVDAGDVRWEKIDDYGRTLFLDDDFSCYRSKRYAAERLVPALNIKCILFNPGNLEVELIVAPTLNFVPGRGLRVSSFL